MAGRGGKPKVNFAWVLSLGLALQVRRPTASPREGLITGLTARLRTLRKPPAEMQLSTKNK